MTSFVVIQLLTIAGCADFFEKQIKRKFCGDWHFRERQSIFMEMFGYSAYFNCFVLLLFSILTSLENKDKYRKLF